MTYSKDDLEKIMSSFGNPKQEDFDPVEVMLDSHFLIENIECRDHKGTVFERYDRLLIPKKPIATEKYEPGADILMTNIVSAQYVLDLTGRFMPSAPLLANILIRLWDDAAELTGDACNIKDIKKYNFVQDVLDSQFGITTNTVIDYDNQKIINYPEELFIEPHSDYSVPKGFNEGMMHSEHDWPSNWPRKIRYGNNSNVSPTSEILNAKNVLGQTDLRKYREMLDHFNLVGDLYSHGFPDDNGISGISFGSDIWCTQDIDETRRFTYCMIPKGGASK